MFPEGPRKNSRGQASRTSAAPPAPRRVRKRLLLVSKSLILPKLSRKHQIRVRPIEGFATLTEARDPKGTSRMRVGRATLVRMKRLTLAVAGPAFCLGALSQDLTLSIEPAVHVTWPSTTNKAYQVEVSSNLAGNWAAAGPLVEGTGGRVGAYLDRTT